MTLSPEGIETAEQLECLRLMGYRRDPGFHFSKPLPPAPWCSFGADGRRRFT